VAIGMTSYKNSVWWKESMGVGIALAALQNLKPLLPEDIGKYLP
jgi:membrane protein required for colicin V production